MDALFHFGSAACLAYALGEERPRALIAAGALGLVPDLLWPLSRLSPDLWFCYTFPHTFLFNALLCVVIAVFVNWRIAFGPMLHAAIDAFTHVSSTKHFLYPFFERRLFAAPGWWQPDGWTRWAGLWMVLIGAATLVIYCRKRRRRRGIRQEILDFSEKATHNTRK